MTFLYPARTPRERAVALRAASLDWWGMRIAWCQFKAAEARIAEGQPYTAAPPGSRIGLSDICEGDAK
jgi:uncharacterized protein YbjT (DUF2867 family)